MISPIPFSPALVAGEFPEYPFKVILTMRLLLLEDDRETADYILRGFQEDGCVVDHAVTGPDALMMAAEGEYDALVLDRMVPGLDGLQVLNALRASGNHAPAIFLTAVGSVQDRVAGLQVADDYLVKPFAFMELRARIAALVRRPQYKPQETRLTAGGLEVDLLRRQVFREGRELSVQPTEFRLLEYLLRHKGEVVTRTMLLENVWDFHFDPKTNIVETHISRLRSKVDKGFERELIRTVRGSGYMVDDAD